MAEASGSRQVVIIGGGLAGLFAARALRNAPVQVTLLDRAEPHLFPPLLYQCATGIRPATASRVPGRPRPSAPGA
jgi:NADH:quinone reductase (non-electrogenic)